ncbi:Conserved_hypothetical protein [Hexamita inflata]|uniref:Uncharacterized protein n=1 Tax=Hexamita inflata TaxID=28002 RepID=A0AA86QDW5_9EUKA|nr:Conserved hypothetical protein [Hexamita inflata]
MIAISISVQLTCFTSNSTLILERQTNIAQLTLFPLASTASTYQICQQLNNQKYIPKICFGTFCITGSTQQFVFNQNLNLNIQCLSNCQNAFAASSSNFEFTFEDTKTTVSEAISVFKIENYNRLECVHNLQISYSVNLGTFKIITTQQQCDIKFIGGIAKIAIFANPDFNFEHTVDLTGMTQLQQLLDVLVFSCDDFTGTQIRSCQRMLEQFQDSISNYADLTLEIPTVTVSPTGYDRASTYLIHFPITAISSSFLEEFDCYTEVKVTIFNSMMKAAFTKNASAVNCVKSLIDFVGPFDHTLLQLQVQEFTDFLTGRVFTFSFNDIFADFGSELWIDCVDSIDGYDSCVKDLKTVYEFTNPVGVVAWELKYNGVTTREVQLSFTGEYPPFQNADANISRTQFCFNASGVGTSSITKMHLELVKGHPEFMVNEHAVKLDFRAQVMFPTTLQQYCFEIDITGQESVYEDFMENQEHVTGILSSVYGEIGVMTVKFESETKNVNYFIVVGIITLVIGAAWLLIARKFV